MTRKNQTGLTATLLWAALASLPVASIILVAGVFASVQAQDAAFPLPTAAPKGETVRLDGSESMSLVGQALKQKYEKDLSGKVEATTSGVEGALEGLATGKVDTALIGRELSEEEKAKGLSQSLLEREKIAIVVGADNPFSGDIGYAQFAKIFRGEIKDWSELGGPAGAIRLIDRPDTSDTRQSFSTYPVFKSAPFQAGATAAPLAEDDTALMVKQLGKDGVGYALFSQVKDLPGVKVIPMHKVLPSDPAYPYSQPRVLAYKGEPNEATKAFLGFASNEPGKAVLDSVEAAEAEAIAAGNSPNSPDLLQKVTTGAAKAIGSTADGAKGAVGAAGDAAKGAVGAAGDAAKGAVGAAGDAAKGTVDAAGNVVGAAGDAAKGTVDAAGNVVGAAGDAAKGTVDAAGNVVGAAGNAAKGTVDAAGNVLGNTANAVTGVDRNISPLWGILPLAGLAAGGGLLWWLAAGKDDDKEDELRERDRVAVGANAGRDTRTGTLHADNLRGDGYRPDLDGSIDGIQARAGDLGSGAVDGIKGVGSSIKGVGTDIGSGLGTAAGNAARSTGNVVKGAGAAAAGLGAAALGGAAAVGRGGSNLFDRAKDAAGNAVDAAGNVVGDATGAVGDGANRLKDGAAGAVTGFGDAAGNVAGGVAGTAGNAAGATRDAAGNLLNRGTAAAGAVGAGVAGASTGLFGRVKDALSGAANATGDEAQNLKDGAVDLAGGVKDGASDLAGGVKDGASGLVEGVQGTTTNAADAAQDRWDEMTND